MTSRALGLALVALAGTADARPASSGWYAEGGLGAAAFLPGADKDAAVGPGFGIRAGYDVFSFLSLGVSLGGSSHEATVPAPPEGEWFQIYRAAADARLTGRIGRLALFAEGGAGVGMISSNVLGKVMITEPGERFSLLIQAGGGLEYQLANRHYAIGLGADALLLPQFDAIKAIDGRAFLRYTY
jgi:hypothetical protein